MIIPKLIQNCRECKTCKVMVQTQTPSYRHNLVSTCSLFSSKREQKLTHSFSYCWFILESHKKKSRKKKKQTNKKELHIIQAYNFSISLSFLIGSTKDTFSNYRVPLSFAFFSNISEFSLQQDSQIHEPVMEEQTMELGTKPGKWCYCWFVQVLWSWMPEPGFKDWGEVSLGLMHFPAGGKQRFEKNAAIVFGLRAPFSANKERVNNQ